MRSVIYFMGSVQIYGVSYLCYEVGPESMGVFFFFIKKINMRDNG